MIDLEKQNKEFEKWVKNECPQIQYELNSKTDDDYDSGSMSWAWASWKHKQAEIDSLKAQLRELNDTVQHLKTESSGVHAALREQQRTNEDLLEKLFGVEAGEYVIVPKEPTLKMLKVADKHVMDCNATPESAYKAMIEAARENSHE